MANFYGFEPHKCSWRLFWFDRGESLPLKPISIMDPGHCVQMNPLKAFLWPLEASRRPKTGLKMANFHGFQPHTPSGRLFGWMLASKAIKMCFIQGP